MEKKNNPRFSKHLLLTVYVISFITHLNSMILWGHCLPTLESVGVGTGTLVSLISELYLLSNSYTTYPQMMRCIALLFSPQDCPLKWRHRYKRKGSHGLPGK